MAIIVPRSKMSTEAYEGLLESSERYSKHPELLTGDNIGDMSPEDEAIAEKVFASFTPEQWQRWREQRKAKSEQKPQNSEK